MQPQRDYWIYQPRPSPESWAAHLYCAIDDHSRLKVEICFYSERVKNRMNRYDYMIIGSYDRLVMAFEDFGEIYGYEIGYDDIKEISKVWARIARDYELED